MTTHTETMGDAVDRHGPCELFVAIADLADAVGRVPVGEWAYTFTTDPQYRLWVNGGAHDEWHPEGCPAPVDRFYAYVAYNGWPAALVCPAGGWCSMVPEAQLLEAFAAELAKAQR